MALAAFNPSGAGGLTPLIPAASGLLMSAVVRTSWREPLPRRLVYTFPGISGMGSLDFGLNPGEIVWDWTLETLTLSLLSEFEKLLRAYRGAGRFRLESEIDGQYWDNVELARYEPQPPLRVLRGSLSRYLRLGRVFFEWMQPGWEP